MINGYAMVRHRGEEVLVKLGVFRIEAHTLFFYGNVGSILGDQLCQLCAYTLAKVDHYIRFLPGLLASNCIDLVLNVLKFHQRIGFNELISHICLLSLGLYLPLQPLKFIISNLFLYLPLDHPFKG